MARPPSSPTPLPSGPERIRRFADAAHEQWTAWEVEIEYVAENAARLHYLAPELAEGWVAFESERGERRRLAPVPEGWYHASDAHLVELLARAVLVLDRRTPLRPPSITPAPSATTPARSAAEEPRDDAPDRADGADATE